MPVRRPSWSFSVASSLLSLLVRVVATLVRLPLLAINWISVAMFYMLALTKFMRYSDLLNGFLGLDDAVIGIHQYVLPFVDSQAISRAYGTPVAGNVLDLAESGVSVRMRLTASTEALNIPTGAGSAKFYANWAMTTLNLTSTAQLPAFCALAKASTTGSYELFNTSTVVLHKPNVDGGKLSNWGGVKHLPTTIKATTQVVTLRVNANSDSPEYWGCLYRMKLHHLEAFELWKSSTATFNILQADFEINDTTKPADATTPASAWIFDPQVSRLNWFFYRRHAPHLNTAMLISQLAGFALLFASGHRAIRVKTNPRSAQQTRSTSSAQQLDSHDDDAQGHAIVTKRIAHHVMDPTASQGLYYNSLIINLAEVYIILNDRYMIFRCINALDFFMTAGWNFDRFNMSIGYVNLMGSIFWLVLGMQKLLSLALFVVARFLVKNLRCVRGSGRDTQGPTSRVVSGDGSMGRASRRVVLYRKNVEPVLVFIKEATRPRPDLIVLLMIVFPKFFYARFFGGATAWEPINLRSTTSLASNLGANLLITNIMCCGMLIFPLNALFVLVAPFHILSNGWVQVRKPGRVYYQRMTFCRADSRELTFDEGKIDALFALLYYQLLDLVVLQGRKNRRPANQSVSDDHITPAIVATSCTSVNTKRSLYLCLSLRFHDVMHDSLLGELQAFYGMTRAEDADKAYMRYVEHPPGPSPFRSFPIVVVAEYVNRGILLTWPIVSTSSMRGISKSDFAPMFDGHIHLIGADHDPILVENDVLDTKKRESSNWSRDSRCYR